MQAYSIHEGWYDIVKPLIRIIEDNGGVVQQVKEKFGTLALYYELPQDCDPYLSAAVGRAATAIEELSAFVCEFTGAPGRLRTTFADGGRRYWVKTMSDDYWRQDVLAVSRQGGLTPSD